MYNHQCRYDSDVLHLNFADNCHGGVMSWGFCLILTEKDPFRSLAVYMRFVVDRVALEQIPLRGFWFSNVIFTACFHVYLSVFRGLGNRESII